MRTSYPARDDAPCDEAEPSKPGVRAYRGQLKRIVARDPATVVFELCAGDAAFLGKVASPNLVIDDTAWLESRIATSGEEQPISRAPNGTGPFRLDAWNRGELILSRFDGYHGSAARPGTLVFRWDADPRRRVEALVDGSVDGIDGLDEPGFTAVAGNPELVTHLREGLNIVYLGMNDRYAPYDKAAVRQAIARGLDRQALFEAGFSTDATLATHLTPCVVPYGCAGGSWWDSDALAAKDQLAEAGFPVGFATKIQYSDEPRDYLPDPVGLATELQRQLVEDLGIEAELEPLPFDELVARADRGELDGIHLLGARGRYPDPTAFLDPRLGAGTPPEFGAVDQSIRDALARGAATADKVARSKAYAAANGRIRSLAPLVPLAHVGSIAAVRADVDGFHVSPTATEWFAAVSPGDRKQFVWMQASEPPGLYCADETSPDALRVCAQVLEGLYGFTGPDATPVPVLAKSCTPNDSLDVWTCKLRADVRFHDGSLLDANDVVLSYAVQWDAAHPRHRGRNGTFQGFVDRFGPLLNLPAGS
ncbi:MAG: peptide ABC transporter substrate-binding protein [Chloroflexi bacterium]|nr:peptide ABC transporter substrate-binding protein [Chloroflexota bacterium]